jgi:dienelactone hydrolase
MSMKRLTLKSMLFAGLLWLCGLSAQAQWAAAPSVPSRIEVHALQTQTLTGDAFLKGSDKGQSHLLGAELRLPQGQKTKFPAVVLIHGSGGISGSMDLWVHALNQAGVATLVVDTFSGRGITSTVQDQTLLHSLAMMVDGYRALDLLSKHRRIDASKISIMGFSKGAVASIFSASKRFKEMYGSSARFASHIGLYTPCNTRFMGDTAVTGAPMRFFHGTSDDYVNVVPCRNFVAELKSKGVDATLTEFANTQHGYDSPLAPEKLAVPTAQSTRHCQFIEKSKGEMVNAQTGAPFSYTDGCVAVGAHVGHNPDSTAQTVKSVIAFLQAL